MHLWTGGFYDIGVSFHQNCPKYQNIGFNNYIYSNPYSSVFRKAVLKSSTTFMRRGSCPKEDPNLLATTLTSTGIRLQSMPRHLRQTMMKVKSRCGPSIQTRP